MTRLAMAVCLVLTLIVGGQVHARMAGGDVHLSSPATGEQGDEDRAGPRRMATTHCADTILTEPARPPAVAGRPALPRAAAAPLPEGHEPAGLLQPPETAS